MKNEYRWVLRNIQTSKTEKINEISVDFINQYFFNNNSSSGMNECMPVSASLNIISSALDYWNSLKGNLSKMFPNSLTDEEQADTFDIRTIIIGHKDNVNAAKHPLLPLFHRLTQLIGVKISEVISNHIFQHTHTHTYTYVQLQDVDVNVGLFSGVFQLLPDHIVAYVITFLQLHVYIPRHTSTLHTCMHSFTQL